jgi:hypothetical protein
LAALLLAAALPALRHYNVTWDEALGDYFFGERYLSYFLSFDERYLDFEADPWEGRRSPDLSVSPFRDRPWEYYPVANVLAAASSDLFSRRLGWLDPWDGFHAVNLGLAALLLIVLFDWVRDRFDTVAATAACVLLFASPRLFAHLTSNIKDFPEMVFFALSLLVFERAWSSGSRPGLLAAGALWGLALGTKANALFLPPIALVVVLAARESSPLAPRLRRDAAWLVAAVATGLGTVFVLWPYLWADPVGRIRLHLEYIGLRLFATRPESISSALGSLVLTTPLPLLLLIAVGIVAGLGGMRRREARWLLPLAWIVVVLGRLYLPNAVNFDGVRHFLEVFPALAIVAGVGASRLFHELRDRVPGPWARPAASTLLLLLLAPGAWATAHAHPLQLAWWNPLAGGLSGARASGQAQAGDYWGTSYRGALRWLDENAPANAVLAVPLLQHTVRLVAPDRLRADIDLLDIARPEVPELRPRTLDILTAIERERPVYVLFVIRDDWRNSLIDDCRQRLTPVVRWQLDGEQVTSIYRWTPPSASDDAAMR